MSTTGPIGVHGHLPGSRPELGDGRDGPAFSLLRASVPTRLGVVAALSAALWLAILWALA